MSRITFIIMTVLMARIMLTVQYDIDDASAKKHTCAYELGKEDANCDTRAGCHPYISQPGQENYIV